MIESSLARSFPKIAVLSLLLLCSVLFVPSVFADETIQLAPVNPAFQDFIQSQQDVGVRLLKADGEFATGYIPPPVDLSHLTGQQIFQSAMTDSPFQILGVPPASYDLRTLGKLSPVKNQSSCGDCWAFATMGSLESGLLTKETWNFSENNLKNTHGFDFGHCSGGNGDMSTAYLARWSGAINETDDPYNIGSNISPSGLTVQRHVQDVIFIPARANSTDNTNIKQAVMDYGAVMTSYYASAFVGPNNLYPTGACYSSTCTTYNYTGANQSDHAVAIVGWDDTFPSSSFSPAATGNGAFIIRNSWGTTWGVNGGYFYISYYDTKLGYDRNHVFHTAESPANYSRIYQYDPLGWTANAGYGYGSTTAWFANIFTAAATEQVSAVSFYTASPNSAYEIYVYSNVSAGAPRSGSLGNTTTGTLATPGYHTVSLGSLVPITAGQRFSVVVKLTTPGYNWPIPMERPVTNYSTAATAAAGQSFISSAGSSWTDLTTAVAFANVCVKAFTEPSEKIGIFDQGTWYLDSNQSWAWNGAPSDTLGIFGVGLTGAVPVVGDWTGDRKTKIGVFIDGIWYLDMNRSWQWDGEPTDKRGVFGVGLTGAIPVVGDWTGDGITKIGVYMDGTWYLDLNNNWQWDGEPTDKMGSFGIGLTGEVPVVGDWTGDGITKIGVYMDGIWYLDLNNNWQWDGEPTDKMGVFGVGLTGEVPVVGDWNADGIAEIGVYQNGLWYLDKNRSWNWNGEPTDQFGVFGVGLTGVVPVPGKW
ncbi:MAG: hypothetical protein EPN25_11840 [Nitrospirae bacterium]|nr:MAG: hypothetical protein EPN25_11840 [Nitrospirota bacterium]